MRFRAEQRLRRQSDFRTAREQGRRIDCGGFTLWYVKRSPVLSTGSAESPPQSGVAPASGARVGVVASIAAVGIAVRRVRAKRRLREIFRKNQQAVPEGYDLLMVAKRSMVSQPFGELEARFLAACRRIGGEI